MCTSYESAYLPVCTFCDNLPIWHFAFMAWYWVTAHHLGNTALGKLWVFRVQNYKPFLLAVTMQFTCFLFFFFTYNEKTQENETWISRCVRQLSYLNRSYTLILAKRPTSDNCSSYNPTLLYKYKPHFSVISCGKEKEEMTRKLTIIQSCVKNTVQHMTK